MEVLFCFFAPPFFSNIFSFLLLHPPAFLIPSCFLLSFNKSWSDCFSERCWAQPLDQAVVSLPRNIVPEWLQTLFSLCYDFVINVYIFLIFWHHMNKDMYVWMCIYMIYIDRCIYIYIYMTSILEEVTMLDLIFRRWTEMALCGRSKNTKRQKKTKNYLVNSMLSCQTGNHVCYPVHLKTNSTERIKVTRGRPDFDWLGDICISTKQNKKINKGVETFQLQLFE